MVPINPGCCFVDGNKLLSMGLKEFVATGVNINLQIKVWKYLNNQCFMDCVPCWLPFNHTLNKSLFVISIADYLFWGNVYRQPLEGLLNKYTNVMKGWQFRWFVLDPVSGVLEYFEVCCIVYYLPLLIIFEMAVWDRHTWCFSLFVYDKLKIEFGQFFCFFS